MFVLDTNVLIYYAAGNREVAGFFDRYEQEIFYLPSIVVAEFLSYPLITQEVINKFRHFASQTIILNLDFAIAELTAELRRAYKLKLADSIVAASALISDSVLVTRNTRDFRRIKGLRLAEI